MMFKLTLLFSLLGLVLGDVTLPAYYSNGMVMQAGTNNLKIWGFTTNPDVEVLVTVECVGKTQLRADPKDFKRTKGPFTCDVCNGWGESDLNTDKLRDCDSDKGGGGQKIQNFCGHPST